MGYLRYYITTPGLIKPVEIPDGWGLLECGPRSVKVARESFHHIERHVHNEIIQLVRAATGFVNQKFEDPHVAHGSHI